MKKVFTFYVGLTVFNSISFSLDLFDDHKTWATKKEAIKQQLKEKTLPADMFKGQTIIGLDFSGMDLSKKDLKDCKFVKVNLAGANLTNVNFSNTLFDRCNLIGAFFRYSLDDSKDAPLDKEFKITSNDSYELVKKYSDLMHKKQQKKKEGLIEEAVDLGRQAEFLNNLFRTLHLSLRERNLENFNLIGINFHKADLHYTQLSGAWFSKEFRVPSYRHASDLFNAFKEAVNNNTPQKKYYIKLLSNNFNMLEIVCNNLLKEVKWKELDLKNFNFSYLNLHEIDLKGLDLTGVTLVSTDLREANLIGTNFTNTNLSNAKLQGAWFSEDFQLKYNQLSDLFKEWFIANIKNTPNKKYYNMLISNRLNLFEGVPTSCLQAAIEKKLDLTNAKLSNISLSHMKLSGVNLEKIIGMNLNFSESTLTDINLKKSYLSDANFLRAELHNVNFNLSNLNYAYFPQAVLESVSFKGANLRGADFTDSTLEDVDFFAADIKNMILSENTVLPDSDDEQDYINFYYSCTDEKAKALLKIILESRGAILEPRS